MKFRLRREEKIEVGMAPMIDCVFLLLIFFLVTTMLRKEDRDIDISPPTSVSAVREPADDDALVIGIDLDGGFYLDGEPATLNTLHYELRRLSQSDPDRQIRIDADAATPFHPVVQAMDLCQFRGLNDVVIRTYDEDYNQR